MRKRIVIGAIAAVVIGVGAYVLSQPKERSLEWHKREYRRAFDRLYGKTTIIDKVRALCGHLIPLRPRSTAGEPENIQRHQRALIAAGYLSEREFVLTYQNATDVMPRLGTLMIKSTNLTIGGCPAIEWASINSVRVVAPTKDMPVWEELMRQADVPESK